MCAACVCVCMRVCTCMCVLCARVRAHAFVREHASTAASGVLKMHGIMVVL